MTYKEIERRGYLQGKSEGKEEGVTETKSYDVEEIRKASSEGLISPDVVEKLISRISNK